MRFKVLGSGSSGNGYLLISDNGETLVIEAGVRLSEVLKHVPYRNIAGLIVSHAHGDHAGYVDEYLSRRVTTWIHRDAWEVCKKKAHSFMPLHFEDGHPFKVGNFDIIPFRLLHDTPCFGFLIQHPDMTGNFLFCTDTAEIPYTFENVQTMAIEADYDYDILTDNVRDGKLNLTLARRICSTHLSIVKAVEFCKNSDLKKLNNIILLHLSRNNSSAERFVKMMIEATGKPTYVAKAGLEVHAGNNPFQ